MIKLVQRPTGIWWNEESIDTKTITTPQKPTRLNIIELDLLQAIFQKKLKEGRSKQKVLHKLNEVDHDRSIRMCARFSGHLDNNIKFLLDSVLFIEEALLSNFSKLNWTLWPWGMDSKFTCLNSLDFSFFVMLKEMKYEGIGNI